MSITAEKLWDYFMGFSLALLIVGGLAWGLLGSFDFNIVTAITQAIPLVDSGTSELLERVIYVLVGLAAVGKGVGWFNELPDEF